MHKKYHREIVDRFRRLGAENVQLKFRSKHPQLIGTLNGRNIEYTMSGTPGDRRAIDNAMAQIKRMARH